MGANGLPPKQNAGRSVAISSPVPAARMAILDHDRKIGGCAGRVENRLLQLIVAAALAVRCGSQDADTQTQSESDGH